jgi:hypothetical protein
VPELALNDNEWNAFVRHFDSVGVPQLVRREPMQGVMGGALNMDAQSEIARGPHDLGRLRGRGRASDRLWALVVEEIERHAGGVPVRIAGAYYRVREVVAKPAVNRVGSSTDGHCEPLSSCVVDDGRSLAHFIRRV